MKCKAIISQTATGDPKIKPKVFDGVKGAEVTLEVYNVSVDELLGLCERELKIEINVAK